MRLKSSETKIPIVNHCIALPSCPEPSLVTKKPLCRQIEIDPAARCHHFMGESLGECHHSWLCPVDGCDSAAAASHHPASTRSRRGLNLHLLGKIKRGRRYLCHGQVGVLSPNSKYFLGWSSKISIMGWVTINHTPSYLTLAYLSSEVELTTFESLKGGATTSSVNLVVLRLLTCRARAGGTCFMHHPLSLPRC